MNEEPPIAWSIPVPGFDPKNQRRPKSPESCKGWPKGEPRVPKYSKKQIRDSSTRSYLRRRNFRSPYPVDSLPHIALRMCPKITRLLPGADLALGGGVTGAHLGVFTAAVTAWEIAQEGLGLIPYHYGVYANRTTDRLHITCHISK